MSIQRPISSKSSVFLDRWSQAEHINVKLGAMLIVMSLGFFAVTVALIYVVTKPRPIYYVPGVTAPGIAYAQNTVKTTASMFATSWVLDWTNFTPASIEGVYQRAQRFMSPSLLNKTRLRLKKDVEKVKAEKMSSLFSLSDDPQVRDDVKGFNVLIHGDKVVYVGNDVVKQQKTIFKVRLRSAPPTDFNPYGLMIEDINQEVVSEQ